MSFANFRKEAFANKSHAILTILLFAVVIGACIASFLIIQNVKSLSRHVASDMKAFMTEGVADPGRSQDDVSAKPNNVPKAMVGMYVERVLDLDIKQSYWDYEFTLWFRWNPNQVDLLRKNKFVSDEELPFKVIDGTILKSEVTTHFRNPTDSMEYIQYYVHAKSSKFFDVSLYPLDQHDLTVQIEHAWLERNQLLLVPDKVESKISARVVVNGYIKTTEPKIIEKPHRYRSAKGDPRLSANYRLNFSQVRLAMHISRGGASNVFKLFLVLYIAVIVAFVSYFATDPSRYAVGALFTTAGASFILMSKLPVLQIFSFAEILYSVCQIVILLMIVFLALLPRFTTLDLRPDAYEKRMHFSIHAVLFLFAIVLNTLLVAVVLN